MSSLWQNLLENVDGKRICLGIDPHDALLRQWSDEHDDLATAADEGVLPLSKFSSAVLEVADNNPRVVAVKPQSAFFEAQGANGVHILQDCLQSARMRNVPTILDVKRGDIGSTNLGYAKAYLDSKSPMRADAITVSPFLGVEALRNVAEFAAANGRGVFILCLTSNPEAISVQLAEYQGRTVARQVFDFAKNFNHEFGITCGLVVGATIGGLADDANVPLSEFNGPILSPGVGAQGAGKRELDTVFRGARDKVIPSVSRAVLKLGPNVNSMRDYITELV
ncbi:MAG: orotidine-5'-phosphate decarboxylase [Candidatus Ancillula sp.]|jgi:orotidine-5'-phosphate decarboxylase|nr:orotidine-5'-phosphate decarboxylase [Candidatus Ancillula sp.]